jgi:hypothetical protein
MLPPGFRPPSYVSNEHAGRGRAGREPMWGQQHRFDGRPVTSGLPQQADILTVCRHVSKVHNWRRRIVRSDGTVVVSTSLRCSAPRASSWSRAKPALNARREMCCGTSWRSRKLHQPICRQFQSDPLSLFRRGRRLQLRFLPLQSRALDLCLNAVSRAIPSGDRHSRGLGPYAHQPVYR